MPNSLPNKRFFTVKEVAKLLNFSTNTVYKYLDKGKIKSVRLGSEGRFRILGAEVERLIQETGIQTTNMSPILVKSELHVLGAPSLFDWFIGFLSMGLGFSQFVFPSYNLNSSTAPYTLYIEVFQILLFISGVLLISFDILRLKKGTWHTVSHVVLSCIFFLLAGLFVTSGAIPTAVGYLAVALIILLTAFRKLREYSRFLIYVDLLYFLLGIGVLVWPASFFLGTVIDLTATSLAIFFVLWAIGGIVLATLNILALRREGWYAKILAFTIALSAFIYATIAFTNGLWEVSIYCVILASFAIIFPFSNHFQSFTLKSKKEVIGSFAWLIGIFFIGSVALYIIYHGFQNYLFGELNNRVGTANDVVTSFMNGNLQKVSTFATSEDFKDLMKPDRVPDLQEADSHLKELYLSSAGTIRRAVLANSKGVMIDSYPLNLSSQGLDISNRDYFQSAASGVGIYMTGITQPSSPGISPAILISAPIKGSDGRFLGALFGSVDLEDLGRIVGQVKFGQSGTFLLTDSLGNYIIPPVPEKILTKAPAGSLAELAVEGRSGAVQGYDENGNLSFMVYRRIDPYGWGIVARQPLSEAFQTYSVTSFVIFLFFVMSGVASLVFIIYSRRGRDG
jgi:excisionase family DNA binding protein